MPTENNFHQEWKFNAEILDSLPCLVVVCNPSGKIEQVNKTCENVLNISTAEIRGKFLWESFFLPEDSGSIKDYFFKVIQQKNLGKSVKNLTYWLPRSGQKRLIDSTGFIIGANQPCDVKIAIAGIDLTKEWEVHNQLLFEVEIDLAIEQISAALLHETTIEETSLLAFEQMRKLTTSKYGFVSCLDIDTNLFVCNAFMGQTTRETTLRESKLAFDEQKEYWGPILKNRNSFIVNNLSLKPEFAWLKKEFPEITRFMVIPAKAGDQIVGQIFLADAESDYKNSDIFLIERIAALLAIGIRRRHEKTVLHDTLCKLKDLETIVVRSPAVAFLLKNTPEWPVEYISKNIDQFGYAPEDFTSGRISYTSILLPEDLDRIGKKFKEYSESGVFQFSQEYRVVTKSNQVRWVDDRTWIRRNDEGEITHFEGMIIDITERKLAETEKARLEQLLERDKRIKALGNLTNTVAHEFNTLLTSIIGYSEMLRDDFPPGIEKDNVIEILYTANRGKDLVNQVLELNQKSETPLESTSLLTVINKVIFATKKTTSEKIEFKTKVDAFEGIILVDMQGLHEVLERLLLNACQAMAQKGGVLTIETRRLDLAPDMENTFPDLKSGSYLEIIINDTGIGMDKKILDHLFEPFFTTKPIGDGKGLGLMVAYSLVTKWGGIIRAESEPGKGSTFSVFIPLLS